MCTSLASIERVSHQRRVCGWAELTPGGLGRVGRGGGGELLHCSPVATLLILLEGLATKGLGRLQAHAISMWLGCWWAAVGVGVGLITVAVWLECWQALVGVGLGLTAVAVWLGCRQALVGVGLGWAAVAVLLGCRQARTVGMWLGCWRTPVGLGCWRTLRPHILRPSLGLGLRLPQVLT